MECLRGEREHRVFDREREKKLTDVIAVNYYVALTKNV
jgi:hypothetical protein